jgi:transcription elongation factor Elf1
MISTCEDCNSPTYVRLAPYGARSMAEIICPKCGVSYDTNISDEDIEAIKDAQLQARVNQWLSNSLLKTGK